MAFDITTLTTEQQITALYVGYFGRAPDPIGLTIWEQQLALNIAEPNNPAGRSLSEIATLFSREREATNEYAYFEKAYDGIPNNETRADAEAFINQIYLNLFDRPAEPGGLFNWTEKLINDDLTVGEIILRIIEGAGPGDRVRVENKVEVGLDLVNSAIAEGITKYASVPGLGDLATTITDGVNSDPASVAAAKLSADLFFNDAPTLAAATGATSEDGSSVFVFLESLGDDVDPGEDGSTLTYTVTGAPAEGIASIDTNNGLTFAPGSDFQDLAVGETRDVTIEVTATDALGATAVNTVTITVTGTNDAPVAVVGTNATNEDTVVTGSVSATDIDGDALTFSVEASGQPAGGTVSMATDGSYTFTPDADFAGDATFTYTVSDGTTTSTADVTVTVNPIDDAPVTPDVNGGAVDEGTGTVSGVIAATDIDSPVAGITYAANTAVAGFTLNTDGSWTFNPSNAAYNGLAASDIQLVTTTYTATSGALTDTGTINITVIGTNDLPVAAVSAAATTEDNAVSGSVSATDVDGDTLSYSVETQGANGGTVTMTAGGNYTYTPAANYNGTDTFTFVATDSEGGVSAPATVTVTIAAVDDAPVGTTVANFTGAEDDASIAGSVTVTDVDDVAHTFTQATFPSNGTVSVDVATGAFSYVPNANFNGTDSFDVEVFDGTTTITETVNITVTPVNDDPVAAAFTGTTLEDIVFSGQLAATDIDGDALSYALDGAQPAGATVAINPNGTFTVTPDANFSGPVTFSFTVDDNNGGTDTETATITIAAVDDVLTLAQDDIQPSPTDDIITGTELTLQGGDTVDGGDGEDLVAVTIDNNNGNIPSGNNETGFVLQNVETFQVTAENGAVGGTSTSSFDMSSSDNVKNLTVLNSTAHVVFNDANLNDVAGTPDATEVTLNIVRATDEVDVTLDVRDGDATGFMDTANINLVDSDSSDNDVDDLNIDTDIENIAMTVSGNVKINDLNSGNTTMSITSGIGDVLTIGDPNGNVRLDDDYDDSNTPPNLNPNSQIPSDVQIRGISNALSVSVNNIDASAAEGTTVLDFNDSASGAGNGGVTYTGGAGSDRVEGSNNDDIMLGNDGADWLEGEGGEDEILGGDGDDFLMGEEGDDTIDGGDDNDVILGGDGDDNLIGGTGDDTIDTGDNTDNSIETVNAFTGSDQVWTRGEQLDGRGDADDVRGTADILDGGTDVAGTADAAANDVLKVVGTSANTDGLDDVLGFECIDLIAGTFNFTISNDSQFERYNDNEINTNNDLIIVNGTAADNTVFFDASTLNRGIALVGGVTDDALTGGSGDDILVGDGGMGQLSLDGGNDSLTGNGGNDTFIFNADGLTTNDTVSGGSATDTISIEWRDGGTPAVLGAGVTSVENVVVASVFSAVTAKTTGSPAGISIVGDAALTLDTGFNNGTITNVDASAVGLSVSDTFTFTDNATENGVVNVTGGNNDDTFNLRGNLTGADTIDGGANDATTTGATGTGDTLTISSQTAAGDLDFTNVTNVECLVLDSTFTGTLVLGVEAFEAGFIKVDASAVEVGITIDASNFPGPITIIDSNQSNTLIGPDNHPATIELADGSDTIILGSANDVIEIEDGELGATDTITDNGGTDTVVLMNQTGAVSDINAIVNLDNVTGIEQYVLEGTGDRGGSVSEDHTITFQGGNVGTVTDILIDGAGNVPGYGLGEGEDSLDVVIDGDNVLGDGGGADVDADYRFTFNGTDGDDTVTKNNRGVNNDVNFQGGQGTDTFNIWGGDLGASTIFNGGTIFNSGNIDRVGQLGGTFVDDDFIMVSNTEELGVAGTNTGLDATLGFEADHAGLNRFIGGSGDDNVLFDAAFGATQQSLFVNLSAGGDDNVDASALGSNVQMRLFVGDHDELDGSDSLMGPQGTNDELIMEMDNDGTTGDMSGVSGFETVTLGEGGFEGPFTLIVGATTTTDAANNALTINTVGSSNTTPDRIYLSEWDGEQLTIDATEFTGDLTFNGSLGFDDFASRDTVLGGSGNDELNGGGLADSLVGNGGNDLLNGGTDNDTLEGGAGRDTLNGDEGNDVLDGGAGNFDDTINGGIDNDTITGGGDGDPLNLGGDVLSGDGGNDNFRYVNFTDSNGLNHDFITDFVAEGAEKDTIQLEETVLQNAVGAGAPVTGIAFAGNAASYGQAQLAVGGLNANDGIADYVFQTADGNDPAGLWVDVNDDGVLNNLDIFIEMTDASGPFDGDEVTLIDTVAPDAPVIASVSLDSSGPNGTNDDFNTQDRTFQFVTVEVSTANDGTGAAVGDDVVLLVTGTGPLVGTYTVTVTQPMIDGAVGGIMNVGFALPDGAAAPSDNDYSMTAVVVDNFGLVTGPGTVSEAEILSIDTEATIAITGNSWTADNGTNTPNTINGIEDDAVAVNGTTTGVEIDQVVTVTFSDGVTDVTATAVVGATGAWSLNAADLSGLTNGPITVDAEVLDQAGNLANAVQVATSLDNVATIDVAAIFGESVLADNIITAAENTPGVIGVNGTTTGVDAGGTVQVSLSGPLGSSGPLGGATVDGAGNWTVTSSGSFTADGEYTITATATDSAGNVSAADTFIFDVDTTGPAFSIDSIVYDETTGTITVNGDFSNVAATDTVDVTQAIWQDAGGAGAIQFAHADFSETIALGASTPWFGTPTQVVLTVATPVLDTASVGGPLEDSLDFGAGTLVDALGNGSLPVLTNEITLDISTTGQAVGTLTGFGGDDVLTADTAVTDVLTGGLGADTFIIDTPLAISVVGAITDFTSADGDSIVFNGVALDALGGAPFGGAYTAAALTAGDGGTIAFRTYVEDGSADNGDAVAATTFAGTIIFDTINGAAPRLLIDVAGDTSFNGFAVLNTSDDLIVDLTGIAGAVTATDISFISFI